MTQIDFHPAVERDLKRLPKQFSRYVLDTALDQLRQKSLTSAPLKGILKGLRKVRLHHQGVSYRMIIELIGPDNVRILLIAKRGDVYQRLRQRLQS